MENENSPQLNNLITVKDVASVPKAPPTASSVSKVFRWHATEDASHQWFDLLMFLLRCCCSHRRVE